MKIGFNPIGHSLTGAFPSAVAAIMRLSMILAAGYGTFRASYRNPKFAFAFSLAISTYHAGMSFDYNLITQLPLLILLVYTIYINNKTIHSYIYILFVAFVISTLGPTNYIIQNSSMLLATRLIIQTCALCLLPILLFSTRTPTIGNKEGNTTTISIS